MQRFPGTTNAMRIELGLPQRGTEPVPIPPPAFSPDIDILSVTGRTVHIRLHDANNPALRGRPAGVNGASIFSHVGASAPEDPADWHFEGVTSRTRIDVVFPDTVPAGSTVWLTANWFNPRKQTGVACPPVSTNLAGGSALPEAA